MLFRDSRKVVAPPKASHFVAAVPPVGPRRRSQRGLCMLPLKAALLLERESPCPPARTRVPPVHGRTKCWSRRVMLLATRSAVTMLVAVGSGAVAADVQFDTLAAVSCHDVGGRSEPGGTCRHAIGGSHVCGFCLDRGDRIGRTLAVSSTSSSARPVPSKSWTIRRVPSTRRRSREMWRWRKRSNRTRP